MNASLLGIAREGDLTIYRIFHHGIFEEYATRGGNLALVNYLKRCGGI